MTISPSQAEARAVELARLYAEAETEVIRLLAQRLAQGIDGPQWAERKLADLNRLRVEIEADLARLNDAGTHQLRLLITEAYETGLNSALDDLRTARVGFGVSATNTATIEAFMREAALKLQSTHLAVLRQVDDVYRAAVAEGTGLATAGVETRRQATQRVLNGLADRGVSGFVDAAGRRWELQSYAEMATRTALGRAAVQGHIDTLQANGQDLVIVSDSPEECPLCRPWEGQVLSLSGRGSGVVRLADGSQRTIIGSVSDARAAGLFHPNCTHRLGLFVPGLTKPLKGVDNPQGYDERQRQRELERNIRRWKRREAAALTPAEEQAATRMREQAQARLRTFVEDTGRRRISAREQVIA